MCAGRGPEWVEHHGERYDFDPLMISPAPDVPVPTYVGAHSEPGLRRTDVHDVAGCRELAEMGVTACQVSPWRLYSADFHDRQARLDSVRRFADEVIHRY